MNARQPDLSGPRVAALFVDPRGPYADLPGVDAWDESRDARCYPGTLPVVAHPPCARWGNYRNLRPGLAGEDGGAFASALAAVRKWGGILEHPARTLAWPRFGLAEPPTGGGWVRADWLWGFDGWTCEVYQGAYGHRAPKATWLYAQGVDLPELSWGIVDPGHRVELMGAQERRRTPEAFRDLLLSIAATARPVAA